MTGRPRKADPDGKRAWRRTRKRLANATKLAAGEQVRNHGDHHSGMKLLKLMLEDGVPATCHCGDEQVTLSLVGTAARYAGYNTNTKGPYILSTDPNDYVWECHHHNVLRGHPTLETNAGTDPALD